MSKDSFHLTGICVCVNYDDFLSITLPQNIQHFDKFIVITSESDTKTAQCVENIVNDNNHIHHTNQPYNKRIELIKTNIFYIGGSSFNKGASIRHTQKKIINDANIKWVCIIDADIVLPINFREVCIKQCKNTSSLYGAKRINYESYDDYIQNKPSDSLSTSNIHEVGVGFLQIYHQSQRNPKYYSSVFRTASSCDTDFKNKWGKSIIDIGVYVKHLGESRSNWKGRITQQFTIHN